jgi:hypothetical protein
MALVLKPPSRIELTPGARSVFLAGSIEMGSADDWQAVITSELEDLDISILNPRRDAWDASWEQSKSFPPFREQVEWELEAQERATVIAMYFAPTTKAPVTLLELGLCAKSRRLIVCCPSGYWRRGNVEIVCMRYGVRLVPDLEALARATRAALDAAGSAPTT